MAQDACVRTFERYIKRKRVSIGMQTKVAQGRREGDTLTRIDKPSETYSVARLLRHGYTKDPVTREWLTKTWCEKPLDVKRLNKGGMDFDAWETQSRQHWLTIDDVLALPPGRHKFVMIDRNVLDTVSNGAKRGVLYDPARFFRNNAFEFTRAASDKGIAGKGRFLSYEKEAKPWEFDVEYARDRWFPLRDGALDYGAIRREGWFVSPWRMVFSTRAWTNFPGSTHVGWRGPMIPWSDAIAMPKVYYT